MLILKYWLKVKGLVNTDKCKSYFSSYVFYLLVLIRLLGVVHF